jgi:hypothetical protein
MGPKCAQWLHEMCSKSGRPRDGPEIAPMGPRIGPVIAMRWPSNGQGEPRTGSARALDAQDNQKRKEKKKRKKKCQTRDA